MANKIDSVNSVNFNIGSGSFSEGAKPALTAIRKVQGMTKKNSLSAMVNDLIMQYPLIIDADIDTESMIIIAKGNEKNYAALQLALWSADTAFGIDPTSDGNVRTFIKKYHNNDDTPDLVSYTGNLARNISNFIGTKESVGSTEVELTNVRELNEHFTKEALESLWETVEDRVTVESVNDLYTPTKAVLKKMKDIATAMEAGNGGKQKFKIKHKPNSKPSSNKKKTDSSSNSSGDFFDDFAGNLNNAITKDTMPVPYFGKTGDQMEKIGKSLNNAKFVTDKRLTSLEPILLEVEFFVRGPGGGQIKKAIIGVKVMTRAVPSGAMAANIIAALNGSNKAFQFVKWTRGETKFIRDTIFNISQIKQDALTKDRFQKYFGAMRKRKNNFKTFKFGDTTVNPFTTIAISMSTAERIKQTAGYDLTDPNVAKKLISCLFLLGFQIVDTNTGVVSTILDDWNYFSDTTIDALREESKKNTDADLIKELMRVAGRSY